MKTEIVIPVSILKQIIIGFAKVISPRNPLPVLGCLRFKTVGGVHLTISGTNLDDYVQARLNSIGMLQPFDALIPFDQVAKLVKSSGHNERLTFVSEGDSLKVRHTFGGTVFEQHLPSFPLSDFPEPPVVEALEGVSVGREFKEALLKAFESTSNDQSRYILNHAFIDVSDPKSHYVVGTDGKQLFSANSFHLHLKQSFTLPKRKFLLWNGFADDGDWTIRIGVAAKEGNGAPWLRIESESWRLITKGVEGNYPQWKQVIPSESNINTVVAFSPEAADLVCLAVPRLPGRDEINSGVKLHLTRTGSLILEGKTEKDQARVPIAGATLERTGNGEPVEAIALNGNLLVKALKAGLTTLQITDASTPLIFRKDGSRLVVAPLVCPPEPTAKTAGQSNISPTPEAVGETKQESTPEEANHNHEMTSALDAQSEEGSDSGTREKQGVATDIASVATSTTETNRNSGILNNNENPQPEEKETTMKTTNRIIEMQPATVPFPSTSTSIQSTSVNGTENQESALLLARDQVEKAKETCKSLLTDLQETARLLQQAAREKKASDREIVAVRSTLRSLQKVQI